MRHYKRLFAAAAVLLFSSTCQSQTPSPGFDAESLLILDPLDSQATSTEMLAVYSVQQGGVISFRIDFLDFTQASSPRFTIVLDTFPGAQVAPPSYSGLADRWEVRLEVRPHIPTAVIQAGNQVLETIAVYDHLHDTVVVSMPIELLHPPGPYKLAVVSYEQVDGHAADSIGPVRSDVPTPSPIPLMLAFWNSFLAASPAQALRSWDGAHHGPAGERFGLHHLLDAVELSGVPIVLADVNQPHTLQGLSFLGSLPWLYDLERQNLVSLPNALSSPLCELASRSGWPDELLDLLIGSPDSPVMSCSAPGGYRLGSELPTEYQLILTPSLNGRSDGPSVISVGRPPGRVIATGINSAQDTLSTDGGLALLLRTRLASAIVPGERGALVIFGADFPDSFWGDPGVAQDSLNWIAAHPWIKTITAEDIVRHPFLEFRAELETPDQPANHHPSRLLELDNVISELLGLYNQPVSRSMQSFTQWYLLKELAKASCLDGAQWSIMDPPDECGTSERAFRSGLDLLMAATEWEQNLFTAMDNTNGYPWRADSSTSVPAGYSTSIVAILNNDGSALEAIFSFDKRTGALPILWAPGAPSLQAAVLNSMCVEPSAEGDQLSIRITPYDPSEPVRFPLYIPPHISGEEPACNLLIATETALEYWCGRQAIWRVDIDATIWNVETYQDSPAKMDPIENPNQEMPAGHYLSIPFAQLEVWDRDTFTLSITNLMQPPPIR